MEQIVAQNLLLPRPLQSSLSLPCCPHKLPTLPSIVTTFSMEINHDHSSHALRVATIATSSCLLEVRATTEPDSNVSGENHETFDGGMGESDGSGGSETHGSQSHEVDEEIQPMRRFMPMDSSAAAPSVFIEDVVDLNYVDIESSDDQKGSCSKEAIIADANKQGSGGSSSIYKWASIGRALQKRPILVRRSFSSNKKCLFSRHGRSQSSTLPL